MGCLRWGKLLRCGRYSKKKRKCKKLIKAWSKASSGDAQRENSKRSRLQKTLLTWHTWPYNQMATFKVCQGYSLGRNSKANAKFTTITMTTQTTAKKWRTLNTFYPHRQLQIASTKWVWPRIISKNARGMTSRISKTPAQTWCKRALSKRSKETINANLIFNTKKCTQVTLLSSSVTYSSLMTIVKMERRNISNKWPRSYTIWIRGFKCSQLSLLVRSRKSLSNHPSPKSRRLNKNKKPWTPWRE